MGAEFYGIDDTSNWDKLTDDDNPLADRGTALHSVLEAAVNPENDENKPIKDYMVEFGVPEDDINDKYVVDKMQEFRSYILENFAEAEEIFIEKRTEVNGVPTGGTVDYAWISDGTLYIRDLKTGRLEVESRMNKQFMLYALGILDLLEWPDHIHRINLQSLGLHWSKPEWTVTPANLRKWRKKVVIPAYIEAYKINPVATAGDWCTHCEAKIHCEEFQLRMGSSMNNEVFENTGFDEMETEDLEDLAVIAKQSEKFFDAAKTELLLRSEGFTELQNFKLCNGKRMVAWKDEKAVVRQLSTHVTNKEQLYDRTLKKPQEIQELLGENGRELVDSMIKVTHGLPFLKLK